MTSVRAPAARPAVTPKAPAAAGEKRTNVAAQNLLDTLDQARAPGPLMLEAPPAAPAPAPLVGRAWIQATQFEDRSQGETLSAVLASVRRAAEEARETKGPKPVVIFDIDNTLFPVEGRRLHIIQEWLQTPEGKQIPKRIRDALDGLAVTDLEYSMDDTLVRAGLSLEDPEVKASLDQINVLFKGEFFTNEHLLDDQAYAGASEYVQALHEAGAEIVYLTGRTESTMQEGTRAALERDGFPLSERASLIMKPAFEMPDVEFKTAAFEHIAELGTVVASFDNEPANIVAMARRFPEAASVFVDTLYSKKAADVVEGLSRVRGFIGVDHDTIRGS